MLSSSVTSDSMTLWTARLLYPWDFSSKNTAFLQGLFQTQGLNSHFLHLLHCRTILLLLSHWRSPMDNKQINKIA